MWVVLSGCWRLWQDSGGLKEDVEGLERDIEGSGGTWSDSGGMWRARRDLRVSSGMWGGGHQLRWDMRTSMHPSTPSSPLWQNRGIYMFRINNEHVIDATLTGGPAR